MDQRQRAALAAVLATVVGTVLTLELVRAWLPGILFIYGDAGSTPATRLALFAVIPFAVAFLVAATVARVGARPAALLTVALVLTARLLLQASSGDVAQLVSATLGVAGALGWLVSVAAGALPRRAVAFGLVVGLAADALLHGALRTQDLVWRQGAGGWVGAFLLVATMAVATWAAHEPETELGPAWPWLLTGPVLMLHAIVGTASHLAVTAPLGEVAALAVIGAGHTFAVAAVLLLRRGPSRAGGVLTAGLVLAGLFAALGAAMPFDAPAFLAAGHVALTVGLALALGTIGWAVGRRGPLARGLTAATGLLLLFVLALGYYAGYDIALGFDNRLALWAAAGVVALVTVAARPLQPVPGGGWFGPALTVSVALATLVAVVAVALPRQGLATELGDGFPVRVMTYNIHMGYDVRGRFDPTALADVVREQRPDIVALNEVDRGWLTTGATDVLPLLAERVGLPYVFAPAADAVWGNALLSRFPLRDVQVDLLPSDGRAMRRSALSAVVDVGGGQDLGVIVTHLHHVDDEPGPRERQARRVAAIAEGLLDSGFPVVVMGDLNAEAGDAELTPLEDLLVNATAVLGAPATFPSTRPVERVDHVLVSSPLEAEDLAVPGSTASDHLAVAVTLDLQG